MSNKEGNNLLFAKNCFFPPRERVIVKSRSLVGYTFVAQLDIICMFKFGCLLKSKASFNPSLSC